MKFGLSQRGHFRARRIQNTKITAVFIFLLIIYATICSSLNVNK